MGMDYKYAGCASYPRFEREVCEVAKIFGGEETKHIKARKEIQNKESLEYWFGFLNIDDTKEQKIIFPQGTNEILVKWFNDIYSENFTPEETKIVWDNISKHPEIDEISHQIWYELETLCEENEAWEIY